MTGQEGTGQTGHTITAYHLARIVVGCFFAEGAFLLVQIVLTLVFLPVHYPLRELLFAGNPLYALPPHFYSVAVVFAAAAFYGAWNNIRFVLYYVGCGLLAALAFHAALFLWDGTVLQASAVVINCIAAVISGLAYWALAARSICEHH